MGERSDDMSSGRRPMELREFLGEHNMGITTLAKLIGVSRNSILRYEDNPKRCVGMTRIKIEVALEMIREENWVRPILDRRYLVDSRDSYCLRENHLMDVVRFEREFRERFEELFKG